MTLSDRFTFTRLFAERSFTANVHPVYAQDDAPADDELDDDDDEDEDEDEEEEDDDDEDVDEDEEDEEDEAEAQAEEGSR